MNCDAVGSLFQVASRPLWTEIASGKFYDLSDLCGPGRSTSERNNGDFAPCVHFRHIVYELASKNLMTYVVVSLLSALTAC